MKRKGNGKAKVLVLEEMQRLFNAFVSPRDKLLFGICFFTGCRVSEALQLETADIVGDSIVFRKGTTKGKLQSRVVALHPQLEQFLVEYKPMGTYLFPSKHRGTAHPHLSRNAADRILKEAAKRAGILGVSTHSFRRTALTEMSKSGIPLRHIQEISGHKDLGVLQRYLEVSPDNIRTAINTLRL